MAARLAPIFKASRVVLRARALAAVLLLKTMLI